MKLKITAPDLGKVETTGKISSLKLSGDYVLADVKVNNPSPTVDLSTSLGLSYNDLWGLVWIFLRKGMLIFLISGLVHRNNPRPLPKKW